MGSVLDQHVRLKHSYCLKRSSTKSIKNESLCLKSQSQTFSNFQLWQELLPTTKGDEQGFRYEVRLCFSLVKVYLQLKTSQCEIDIQIF